MPALPSVLLRPSSNFQRGRIAASDPISCAPVAIGKRSPVLSIAAPSRIAVISYHTSPLVAPGTGDAGGMNIYVRETAAAMGAARIEVDIFARFSGDGTPGVTRVSEGVRLIQIEAGPPELETGARQDWVEYFADAVVEFALGEPQQYEGIWSHYWLSGLAAIRLARAWQAPHVASFHTLELAKQHACSDHVSSPQRIAGERKVVDEAHGLIATSEHERLVLTDFYDADPILIAVVPPGVNHRRFHPLDTAMCRQRLGLSDNHRYLLFVGRTPPLKGIEVLLGVVAQMPEQQRLSALVVGGTVGGPDLRRLAEQASELGVSDRVQLVGSVPHAELPTYYGAADVCVVTSYYESYGMVALEAQACGKPVVASDTGGLPAAVRRGLTGLLVPAGSTELFCGAIASLLDDDQLAHRLGSAGMDAVRPRSWTATTNSVLAAIRQCAANRSSPTAA
jgi:D-inositol-3-phosphate glycosyltransferase